MEDAVRRAVVARGRVGEGDLAERDVVPVPLCVRFGPCRACPGADRVELTAQVRDQAVARTHVVDVRHEAVQDGLEPQTDVGEHPEHRKDIGRPVAPPAEDQQQHDDGDDGGEFDERAREAARRDRQVAVAGEPSPLAVVLAEEACFLPQEPDVPDAGE